MAFCYGLLIFGVCVYVCREEIDQKDTDLADCFFNFFFYGLLIGGVCVYRGHRTVSQVSG